MDDAQAVEAAARRFLQALLGGEDLTPYMTDELGWAAPHPTERLGTVTAAVDVRRLGLARLDGGAATVEALAHARQVLDHPVHGPVESKFDFDGRIELVRSRGDWRVVDYTNKGRSVGNAVARPSGIVEDSELALDVPALTLAAEFTRVSLGVENRGPHRVVLSELYRGARAFGLWHYAPIAFFGAVEVPPRSRVVTSAGWRERFPVRTRELRFLLRAGEADGPERFELAFAVRRTPEPRLVALERAPLLFRLPRRVVRYVRLAPIALFVALILFHELRAAGVVFVLYGVGFCAALAVWSSRGRSVRGLVVPGLATVAVGVWLVWTGGSLV